MELVKMELFKVVMDCYWSISAPCKYAIKYEIGEIITPTQSNTIGIFLFKDYMDAYNLARRRWKYSIDDRILLIEPLEECICPDFIAKTYDSESAINIRKFYETPHDMTIREKVTNYTKNRIIWCNSIRVLKDITDTTYLRKA